MYHLWDILLLSVLTSFCKGGIFVYLRQGGGSSPRREVISKSNCWWFVRNPAETHQLRLVVCPIIYKVLYIPRWLFGIFPNHQQYGSLPRSHAFGSCMRCFTPQDHWCLVVTIWKAWMIHSHSYQTKINRNFSRLIGGNFGCEHVQPVRS